MALKGKAARWTDGGTLAVTERAVRAPTVGEVQVAVGSAGICGSDLHFYRGDFPATPDLAPGHEIGGIVSAVGANVNHVKEGDLVGIEPILRCGFCRFCASGDYHVCGDRGLVGQGVDGGMSEYVNTPANTVFPAPRGLDAEAVALAEPLACSVHGYDKARLKGAETVFIVGAGSIGLTAILAARAQGANVIVLARHPHQRDAALNLGATEVLGEDEAGQARMKELVTDGAIDVAVETVGGHGDTLALAQGMVRPKGRVIVLGVFTVTEAKVNPLHLAINEVEIIGSMTYAANEGRADYAVALEVVAQYAQEARSLVTHRFALDDVNNAFDAALDKSSRSIKVHLRP